ncbi:MAG: UvrD-helicase domain-containing protein, partial [Kiritimatiellae bacterium]|nr:UvrD-helicase domain-containing protein [Kiritimatiellia bacterium]
CLIPLDEVLGEVLGVGCEARAVASVRDALVTRLGPELSILQTVPLDQIARTGSSLLAEAIGRMREGKVLREPGYDGEYGSIRLFSKDELSSKEDMPILFELARSSNHEVGTKVPEVRSLESPARTRSGASDPFSSDTSLVQTSTVQGEISASEREAEPREVRNANILSGLDPDQRMAAEHVYGPLLIIAGPGTGKTRTLTHRIAHVLAGYDVSPEHCVAITFTRRAAEEMRERLEKLVPEEAKHITITTFHGLGYRILREFGQVIGLRTDFRVIGDRQQRELVSLCLGVPLASAAYLSRQFSDYRRAGLCRSSDSGLADRIERYTSQKKKLGVVDFDDLIVLPLTILRNNPDVVAKCRERYRWISVDEFQDVDALQYELLRQLVPPEGNICVIGDPDQAIYGFRGTDPRFFAEFLKDFPGATRVVLSRNYRSTGSIVSASMQIISASPSSRSREVKATLDAGVRIVLHEAPTDRAEAEFVVHAIERLLGGSSFFSVDSARVAETGKKSLAFSDFAVLYRTEEQVATLCEALSRSGMPFQKRSHIFLAESPLVIAFVQHLLELPDNMPLSQQLNDAETRLFSDGARKTENDEALLSRLRLLAHSSQDRTEFLSQLEMGQDADLFDPYADRIALLTLHASKGLEFDTVFIVGCEEGVLPIFAGDGAEVEEERRLLFVGMTRARRRLVLSWAKKRMWRGAVREMRPSRFLTDIDKVLLDSSGMEWTGRGRKRPRQLDLF